jgi:hypothetical protein
LKLCSCKKKYDINEITDISTEKMRQKIVLLMSALHMLKTFETLSQKPTNQITKPTTKTNKNKSWQCGWIEVKYTKI